MSGEIKSKNIGYKQRIIEGELHKLSSEGKVIRSQIKDSTHVENNLKKEFAHLVKQLVSNSSNKKPLRPNSKAPPHAAINEIAAQLMVGRRTQQGLAERLSKNVSQITTNYLRRETAKGLCAGQKQFEANGQVAKHGEALIEMATLKSTNSALPSSTLEPMQASRVISEPQHTISRDLLSGSSDTKTTSIAQTTNPPIQVVKLDHGVRVQSQDTKGNIIEIELSHQVGSGINVSVNDSTGRQNLTGRVLAKELVAALRRSGLKASGNKYGFANGR